MTIYFQKASLDASNENDLAGQTFRIAFKPIGEAPFNYPPHNIMVDGKFEGSDETITVKNSEGQDVQVECRTFVFRNSPGNHLLPYHIPLAEGYTAGVLYSNTRSNPANTGLSYEALYPQGEGAIFACFHYCEIDD